MDFGVGINIGDNNDHPPVWNFNPFNSGGAVGVKLDGEDFGGWVKWRADSGFFAEGWVNIGPVQLKIGRNELAWAQWSSLAVYGDGNWASGAASSSDAPFIQVGYVADNLIVYGGLQEAYGVSGAFLGSEYDAKMGMGGIDVNDPGYDPTDPSTWVLGPASFAPFPGFFVGADYTIEDVAIIGGAFAGQYVGKQGGSDDGTFPLMINLHGKILMLNPFTIGINAAFYMAPGNSGLFALPMGYFGEIVGGDKAMVLEAMLDFGINLDFANIGITAALITNFADKKDFGGGLGMKIGASAAFGIGDTGFAIIPGVIYTSLIKAAGNVDAKKGVFDIGVSLQYAF